MESGCESVFEYPLKHRFTPQWHEQLLLAGSIGSAGGQYD
jgi:hypothetical protein